MYELLILFAATGAGGGGITVSQVINFVAALGLGGVIVASINAIAKRRTERAKADNINVDTQTMLSDLIDSSTATLRQSVEDQSKVIQRQKARIEALEAMITELKRELDESVLIQRLRDAEQDNTYLRSRMKTLVGRIDILREENEHLVEELNKATSSTLSSGGNKSPVDDSGP